MYILHQGLKAGQQMVKESKGQDKVHRRLKHFKEALATE
jgi:hypothetical protein